MVIHSMLSGSGGVHIAVWAAVVFLLSMGGSDADESDRPIGDAIRNVPMFDAHMHYKQPAWGPYPVSTVVELMDKAGVAMALVSSTPDAGTIKLFDHAPRRIVPELRPYHGEAGAGNWTKASGMIDYLRARLAKYPHKGIGEFHVHSVDLSDRAFLKQVAGLAAKHKTLVHIHSGAAPVRLFFELEPSLTVLWAHAGMTEPADVVGGMLDRYAALYADTSYRENDIQRPDGTIDPAWKAVITKHADRFMVGSDTWVNDQWAVYDSLIATNRQWLSRFPKRIAEMIAFRNAERLFNRRVSSDLIGKR